MITVVGWLGAGILLAAYALVSMKRLTGNGPAFQSLNIVGALALTVNSAHNHAWPSAALNIVWIGIGCLTMLRKSPAPTDRAARLDDLNA